MKLRLKNSSNLQLADKGYIHFNYGKQNLINKNVTLEEEDSTCYLKYRSFDREEHRIGQYN